MDHKEKAPDRAGSEAVALPSGVYVERDPDTGQARVALRIRPEDLVPEKVEDGNEVYSIRGWGNHTRT